MRIAIVSYEFPPDNACGGIGTYTHEAAAMLAQRGHFVEVFAASNRRSGHFDQGKTTVNLVDEMDRLKFAEAIAPVFSKRHAICNFDIVESPEYFADGREILRLHPETPHVVKLHTPNQLIRSSSSRPSLMGWARHNVSQARVLAGALRRGKRPPPYDAYQKLKSADVELDSLERSYTKGATMVASPSKAMADWAIQKWGIEPAKSMVVPNPYVPSHELLNISPVPGRKVIGFFGRLEYRKGICDLVEAAPRILKEEPEAAFRFVGRPLNHPITQEPFDAYVMRKLAKYRRNIDLTGPIALPAMPAEYGKVDVCVFPSVWENFPYVCLEAMSAGKAVVGSNSGGMAEMLAGDCGLLIPPHDPDAIAESVVLILRSDELRMQMGRRARRKVVDQYAGDSVGPQIERSYERAISLSRAKSRPEPAF